MYHPGLNCRHSHDSQTDGELSVSDLEQYIDQLAQRGQNPKNYAIFLAIACSIFGYNAARNLPYALELIARMDEAKRPYLRTLRKIVIDCIQNEETKAPLLDTIRDALCGNQVAKTRLSETVAATGWERAAELNETKELFYAARIIAGFENWCGGVPDGDQSFWGALFLDADARQRLCSWPDLRSTFLSLGPIYNRLTAHGLPIPGCKPSDDPNDPPGVQGDHFVPAPGAIAIAAVTGHPDGSISYSTIVAPDRPALLLPEDFYLLELLVFNENNESPEMPRIDMPLLQRQDQRTHIWELVWNWPGLSSTALGQTLYQTDMLLSALAREQRLLSGDCNQLCPAEAQAFLDKLRELSRLPEPDGYNGSRFEIHADDIDICGFNHQGSYRVIPLSVKMKIDGDYPSLANPRLNEKKYRAGATASFLTDNFNQLSSLYPVYERHRQLCAVYHCLVKLRKAGFQRAAGGTATEYAMLKAPWTSNLRTTSPHMLSNMYFHR